MSIPFPSESSEYGEPPVVPRAGCQPSAWYSLSVCVASTIFYGASNLILRELTLRGADNDWSLLWKEATGLIVLLPWLLLRLFQGRYRLLSKRLILWLLAGGFICEFVGARLQLYAYVTIGILIAAPLIQGASMSGNALLGRYWLGDRLSIWKKVAIAILLPAVVVTLVGKELTVNSAHNTTTPNNTNVTANTATDVETNAITNITANVTSDVGGKNNFYSYLLAGIGSVVAGFAYAVHMVIVRYAGHKYWDDNRYSAWQSMRFRHWIGYDQPSRSQSRHNGDGGFYAPFPVTLIMAIILFVGILAFGGCLLEREGFTGLWDESTDCWYLVIATGLCNVIGFFFQVQGLRMTAAAQVSIVATGQFVFLALFGMFVFKEQSNVVIWLGVALVVIGVLISAKQEKSEETSKNHF